MNNLDKQYTDLLDDAYKNYDKIISIPVDLGTANLYMTNGWVNQTRLGWIKFTKEEFINKIKTDDEFAKKWGFQVYTRELSLEERMKILINKGTGWNIIEFNNRGHEYMNEENLPTRAISLTYNNQTIEIYE